MTFRNKQDRLDARFAWKLRCGESAEYECLRESQSTLVSWNPWRVTQQSMKHFAAQRVPSLVAHMTATQALRTEKLCWPNQNRLSACVLLEESPDYSERCPSGKTGCPS